MEINHETMLQICELARIALRSDVQYTYTQQPARGLLGLTDEEIKNVTESLNQIIED